MKSIKCHITIDNKPICQQPFGWWSETFPGIIQQCGFKSKNTALKIKRELQKHIWWKRIKIQIGSCPI